MKKFTNLKTKLVGFFLGLLMIMAFGQTGFGQVFITELADPNNNADARYIELYNAGGSDIDFTENSGWTIKKYVNGSTSSTQVLNLTGTIKAGDYYIIAYDYTSGTFLSVYGFAPDQLDNVSNGVAGSNGDDPLELIDGERNVVDQFGLPGTDGTSTSAEYEDGRAERADGINTGQATYVDANWNTWSDGPGGDIQTTQDAPGDFDPGTWQYEPATTSVDAPTAFTATTSSETQIDLAWTQNAATDAVMVVSNTTGTFTNPTDGTAYAVANTDLGGTVIYNESGVSFNHTGLTADSHYYYKAWSVDGSNNYSAGVTADAITDLTAPSFIATYPKTSNLTANSCDVVAQLDETGKVYFVVVANDATAPSPEQVKAGNGSDNLAAISSGTITVDAASTDKTSTATGLTADTNYDIYVVAEDDASNLQTTATKLDVKTQLLIFSDDFEDGTLNKWTTHSISGDEVWSNAEYSGDKFAKIDGKDHINEDWLITSSLDFDNYENCTISFKNANGYNAGGEMKLLISNSYDGTSAPVLSEWTDITASADWSTGSYTWVNTTVDLSAYSGAKVYLAFVYTSTVASAETWEIDNVVISGDLVPDLTAPSFITGYPKSENISTTGCDVVVQLDEVGTAYYLVIANGAVPPTVADVKSANHTINVTAANTDASATISGLTEATAYDICFVAEDAYSNTQASVTKIDVTTAATLSSDADILTFALAEQTGAANIGTNTVDIEVKEGTDVTKLTPTVTISAGAEQVSPTSATVDFTNPVTYEITAEDGITNKNWTVTVTVEATAPVFVTGYPKSANITASSCKVAVQLNEIGTAYYKVLADGATAPTVAEVKAGTAISVTAANTDASATISGLTASTPYDIYFVAEDAYSNTQASVTLLEVTTADPAAPITDLFFSEYIEGSGNNKALEIYNGTDNDIDLSNYVIRVNYNGNPWNEVFELPAISLASGDVYVITSADADANILAVADTAVVSPYSSGTSYIASFNGDDARALCKISGTDTTIIDIIGNPDVDPGDGWDVAGTANATKDHTLSRKTATTSGNIDWAASAGTDADNSEWIVYDKNTFDYLGSFGVSSENDILSFTLPTQTEEATINTTNHTVTINLGYGTDVTALKPIIETSDRSTITDTTVAHDFTNPVVYTVTAQDGTVQEWTATVTVSATPNTEANIKSFVLAEQTGDAVINTTDTTVTIEVVYGTEVDSLTPTIEISYGAQQVSPTSETVDFTNPVTYEITAEDGTTKKNWIVTVTVQESIAVSIHDIQYTTDASGDSPYKGKTVTTSGIITGIATDGFFIQDKKGLWNGVYVFNKYDTVSPAPVIGDRITITAEVGEHYGLTELSYISNYVIDSSNVTLPEAEVITADDIDEAIEGTLIKFEDYTCVNVDFDGHHNSLYVKEGVTDTLMVHNMMYKDIKPGLNSEYTITGIGNWDWYNFKVEPRDSSDYELLVFVDNPPTIENVVITPTAPTSTDSVTVVADYIDDVEVTAKHFYYGLSANNVTTELPLATVGLSGTTFKAIIPAQETGVTVYFKIEASDSVTTTTYTDNYNVITGINDVDLNNIKIYPNPVNDILNIENLTNVKNITISNIIGQKIKSIMSINSEIIRINTSDLDRGIYIISITDKNGNVHSSKLLKQ